MTIHEKIWYLLSSGGPTDPFQLHILGSIKLSLMTLRQHSDTIPHDPLDKRAENMKLSFLKGLSAQLSKLGTKRPCRRGAHIIRTELGTQPGAPPHGSTCDGLRSSCDLRKQKIRTEQLDESPETLSFTVRACCAAIGQESSLTLLSLNKRRLKLLDGGSSVPSRFCVRQINRE